MISTIRTLSFYAGPLDGVKQCLPLDHNVDVIVIEGFAGHYEYTADVSPTHHQFTWRTERQKIVPPPPILPA